ncbi:hypothetical protein [Aureivirga sp. CE67]|uniref:hypothetical protein n=1 Tax=Aureivirga sp. CE67 TaxID=1788983 RepID=UPI0018CB5060|nr:hypothetical protein [Aureivirga sp. CE67]
MFKKSILPFLFILLFTNVFSQKMEIDAKSECNYSNLTFGQSYKNRFSIITFQNRKIYLQNFKDDYRFVNQVSYTISQSNIKYLVKVNMDKDGVNLFFTDKKERKIRGIHIPNDRPGVYLEFVAPFDFKRKEEFIDIVNVDQKTYVLSVNKKSSILNFYEFSQAKFTRKYQVDLTGELTEATEDGLFSSLIKNNRKFDEIDTESENPLMPTFNKNKYYVKDSKLIMTIDQNDHRTYVLNVDLDAFKHTFKEYKKGNLDNVEFKKNSNSFIKDQYLFQMILNKEQSVVSVYNLETDEKVNEFSQSNDIGGSYFIKKVFDVEDNDVKAENFFKKYVNKGFGFEVISHMNTYSLQLSTYYKTKFNRILNNKMPFYGTSFFFGNQTISTINGPITFHTYNTFYYGSPDGFQGTLITSHSSFFRQEIGKSLRINISLDRTTLKPCPVINYISKLRSIADYFLDDELYKERPVLLKFNGSYIIAYVSQDDKYIILEKR